MELAATPLGDMANFLYWLFEYITRSHFCPKFCFIVNSESITYFVNKITQDRT